MPYQVSLTNPASNDFDNLDPQVKEDIKEELCELGDNPKEMGEELSGYKGARRIKISPNAPGVYRAAYYVIDDLKEVTIFAIGTRENFYNTVQQRAEDTYRRYFS